MGNGRCKRLFGILGRSVYSVFSALHCDYIEFKKLIEKIKGRGDNDSADKENNSDA